MDSGELVRKIRLNKKMNQTYLSNNYFTQAALSYFEKNNNQISYQAFREILTKLNMSLDEFSFIQNEYDYSDKSKIFNKFFHMTYYSIQSLKQLEEECEEYLKSNNDVDIDQLFLICRGLISLKLSGDLEQAKLLVLPVWSEVINRKQWYIHDIYFLNSILFVLPNELLIEFYNKVLNRLNEYTNFSTIPQLKAITTLNTSLILIQNKEYFLAEELLINYFSKEKLQLSLTIFLTYLNRLSICYYHTKTADSLLKRELISSILASINEKELSNYLNEEFNINTLKTSVS